MTESIYKEYQNKYYNPNDNDKKPGDNDNWKSIQKGFHDISEKQLETSAGLTLGKGTEDETSVTAAELKEIKNPSQLETSGGLTLGKGTADEVSVTAAELGEIKNIQSCDIRQLTFSNRTLYSSAVAKNNVVYGGSQFSSDVNIPDGKYVVIGIKHDYQAANGYIYIFVQKEVSVTNSRINLMADLICRANKDISSVVVSTIDIWLLKV